MAVIAPRSLAPGYFDCVIVSLRLCNLEGGVDGSDYRVADPATCKKGPGLRSKREGIGGHP